MATADDVNSTLQNIVRQLGQWVAAWNGRIVGGATNATAALTERTLGLYISAKTAASTFSVSCQNGSALGTETFGYVIFTPS